MSLAHTSKPAVVVATADPELLDHVLAVTAAAGVEPTVFADVGMLRQAWSSAGMVMVGLDQAAAAVRMTLTPRAGVHLVCASESQEAACGWSVALGAAVAVLPEASQRLSAAVADAGEAQTRTAQVLSVIGGSGGVGASTLAAGLADVAAQHRSKVLLVDGDPLGGGIDLLVGAERLEGWRWPRLAGASGHLGDLRGHLPQVDGFDVLSTDRAAELGAGLATQPVQAVLGSAARTHDLVVVDLGRTVSGAAQEVLRSSALSVVVISATVRGVAAGQRMVEWVRADCAEVRLVLRSPRAVGLDRHWLIDGLDAEVIGWLADDHRLRSAAERGEPPGRAVRGQCARLCRQILRQLGIGGGSARRAA